jgi:hypothetical protein
VKARFPTKTGRSKRSKAGSGTKTGRSSRSTAGSTTKAGLSSRSTAGSTSKTGLSTRSKARSTTSAARLARTTARSTTTDVRSRTRKGSSSTRKNRHAQKPQHPSRSSGRSTTAEEVGDDGRERSPRAPARSVEQIASTVDGDPVCLDVRRPTSDGDFAIVRFNHDFVPRDAWHVRGRLEPYAGFVAPSFRQFFEDLCMARRIEAQKSSLERAHEDAWAKVHDALRARGLFESALPADA